MPATSRQEGNRRDHGDSKTDEEVGKGQWRVLCLARVEEGFPEEETLRPRPHLRNTRVGIPKINLKNDVCALRACVHVHVRWEVLRQTVKSKCGRRHGGKARQAC